MTKEKFGQKMSIKKYNEESRALSIPHKKIQLSNNENNPFTNKFKYLKSMIHIRL